MNRQTGYRVSVWQWGRHAGWLLLLAGCAHVYVDADGARHVVGFVHLTMPPVSSVGAEWLRVHSVGLTTTLSDVGSAVALGYSDTTLAFVRNNSCVRLDSLPVLLQVPRGESDAPVSVRR